MDVKMPDGTVVTNVPDNITQSELMRRYGASKPDAYTETAQSDNVPQNLFAAVGGAMKFPYVGIKELIGKAEPGEVEEYKKSMKGLWSTPAGKVGTVLGGGAVAAPAMMIPGANTAAGAALVGAGLGALQPVGEDGSRLMNTAAGAGGGVAGKYLGDAIGAGARNFMANRAAQLEAAKAASNPVREATAREAMDAGYVLPPDSVNPGAAGAIKRGLEGISGKAATAQSMAIKNEGVTRALAAADVKLDPSQPITVKALEGVRKQAGTAYEVAKDAGTVPLGDTFASDFGQSLGPYLQLKAEMPSRTIPKVDDLITDLTRPTMEAGTIVELVKDLRFSGFKNVRSLNPHEVMLGRAELAAQDALENALERHLVNVGQPQAASNLRAARTLIAKTHTVENALEESTGRVVAGKIGREFTNGKPLTGGLATIGKTAEAFPKAVQNVNTSMPPISPLDAMGGLLGASVTGHPAGVMLPLARPAVRQYLQSPGFQRGLLPNYEMGELEKLLAAGGQSESTKKLLQLLGLSVPAVAP